MEHTDAAPQQYSDPELDEALARAIRQLIAEAIDAGAGEGGVSADAAA